MRILGLPGVGAIAVPPHILHLYRRGHEFLDISARFCCAGLECGECCVWVTAHPWTDNLAMGELMKHLPNVEDYVASGQLQFVAYDDWYPGDKCNELQAGLAAKMKEAQHRGWPRVRFCGNGLQPLPDSGWMERVRYEQILHELVATSDVAVLCAYRMGTFLPDTAKNELLQTHHAALVTEHDTWEYIPTSK